MADLFRRTARTMAAVGAVALMLAGCGDTPAPTMPEGTGGTKATGTLAAGVSASLTIQGMVVDAANRPIPNATIECLGDVACLTPGQVLSQGHGHRIITTDAAGRYQIVANSGSEGTTGGFAMNANRQGYQVEWRQVSVPFTWCTWDHARCALTVDFRLADVIDQ